MIGASGGVAGVLGAYLLRYPRANILTLAILWRRSLVVRVPALLVIGLWLLAEFASLGPADAGHGGDASFAHLGGFAAGLLLAPLLRTPGLSLLQPARSAAFSAVRWSGFRPRSERRSVSAGR